MKPIGDFLEDIKKETAQAQTEKPKRATERGEIMRFFQRHLNYSRKKDGLPAITMSRLEGIPTKDLYYLKSICTQAKHFSKKFWWEVDPKKHLEETRF